MKWFSKLVTTNPPLDRVQDRLLAAFGAVRADTVPADNILTGKAIAVTDTKVFHGLGREPKGHIVVAQSADARVWDGAESTDPTTYVNLKASAAVTVSLIFL